MVGESNLGAPLARGMDVRAKRFGSLLAILFLGVAAVLAMAGYFYVSNRQADARREAHQALSAIADLKLDQIRNWRTERLSDAHFFSHAQFVAQDVQRFLAEPNNPTNRSAVVHWLNLLKGGQRYYGVVLFDSGLTNRLAIPESAEEPPASMRGLFEQATQSRETVVTDLHQDQPSGLIHLDVVFPIFADSGQTQGPLLAVVLLKLDAREFLFPLVQAWPTPSQTAETLLVRQEGNEVLYLNDLRHQPGTALTLRVPLNLPDLPAARVLRGETQAMEGVDYRGVPVVAAGRKIPGTTWAMISKMDKEEIYAPLRQHTRSAVMVLGSMLLAAALFVVLLWRQRSAQFLKRELVLAERVGHLMRHANDIILLVNRDGRVIEANQQALKAYGYSEEEMCHKGLSDLRAAETQTTLGRDFDRLNKEGSIFFETIHQRRDGTPFPVEVSGRKITTGGESLILSIVRDITQRKAHEREIERLNRLYAALSQVNQAVVRAESRGALLQEICRVLVEFGGFQLASIVWFDERRAEFVPVAEFGEDNGYLNQIQVFAGERPEERCPVGTAIRESRACICNDLSGIANALPWREVALRSGWRSMAAFPVLEGGKTQGALAVFSQQDYFFSAKEEGLLAEVAGDVSFGLEALRKEQQRRQAEEAMRQSEERFRAIFDNAGLGIGEVDRQSVFQVVNERWCQIVRRKREQFLGLNVHDLTHPEDRGTSDHLNADLWAGRVPFISYEKRYLCGDSGFVWVRATVTTIRDSQGEATHAIAMVEDITERRRTDDQLRLQSAALQAAANAIAITDRQGTIQWVNAAFERLTGYGYADVVSRTPRVLKSGQHEAAFYKQMWATILTGKVWRGELVNKRKDGSLYGEEMTITPVTNAQGEITHFIAIKQDITERKRVEAALVEAREHLERTVAERTAQLVEANTNLQTFAYTAAHDLRTPLRAIKSFAEIAIEDYGSQLDKAGRAHLERIEQSSDQMERLLSDLLEYSKLSQTEIKLEPVSLERAVQDALNLLEVEIRAKNADITVRDSAGCVVGHPATVALIVANFISNALKFMPRDRQPCIRIQAEEAEGFVRLAVLDNGIGIEAKEMGKLFNVFQRLHGKQTYPGTGLGLAIVRKGAERMGGRVGVESELGKGSCFWVELPAAEPTG